MNEVVTLPKLAEELAEKAEISKSFAEEVLKALFEQIAGALGIAESVTVDGIGTFTRTADKDNPVRFIPDSVLSKAVNAPFEIFSPVRLDDDVDVPDDSDIIVNEISQANEACKVIDVRDKTDDTAGQISCPKTIIAENPDSDIASETPVSETPAEVECEIAELNDTPAPETTPAEELKTEPEPENNPVLEIETESVSHTVEPEYIYSKSPSGILVKLVIAITGLLAGILIGYMMHDQIHSALDGMLGNVQVTSEDRIGHAEFDNVSAPISLSDMPILADSILADSVVITERPSEPATSARKVVCDTVTTECFLTTLARKHYGPMEYWAFIYQANSDRLRHPNRIKPGTVVVIPDLDSIRQGRDDRVMLQYAKELGASIYARFE